MYRRRPFALSSLHPLSNVPPTSAYVTLAPQRPAPSAARTEPMQPKPSRLRLHLIVLALYAVLALILHGRCCPNLATAVPGVPQWAFDESTFLWNTWYLKYTLVDNLSSPLHSDLIWYPLGIDLVLYTYNFFHACSPSRLDAGRQSAVRQQHWRCLPARRSAATASSCSCASSWSSTRAERARHPTCRCTLADQSSPRSPAACSTPLPATAPSTPLSATTTWSPPSGSPSTRLPYCAASTAPHAAPASRPPRSGRTLPGLQRPCRNDHSALPGHFHAHRRRLRVCGWLCAAALATAPGFSALVCYLHPAGHRRRRVRRLVAGADPHPGRSSSPTTSRPARLGRCHHR